MIRNCDGFEVTKDDVEKIIDWENTAPKLVEIPFKPARVLLQVRFGLVTCQLMLVCKERKVTFYKHLSCFPGLYRGTSCC